MCKQTQATIQRNSANQLTFLFLTRLNIASSKNVFGLGSFLEITQCRVKPKAIIRYPKNLELTISICDETNQWPI